MSSLHRKTIAGSLLTASFSAVLACGPAAAAEDGGGMSSKGGKAVDSAPPGVELTTLLPERISVDNASRETAIKAMVRNEGTESSGEIRLLVVGFDGLSVENVEGCAEIPDRDLPEGSNSGFACAVGTLGAGKSALYDVDATFDVRKKGRICLPVQSADGSRTFWQQGPVPFGSNSPSPNAPTTPLLLGTDNSPVTPGGDKLAETGPASQLLPLGAAGAALVAAGSAALWRSRRRPGGTGAPA